MTNCTRVRLGIRWSALCAVAVIAVAGCAPSEPAPNPASPTATTPAQTPTPAQTDAGETEPPADARTGWWRPEGTPQVLASGLDAPWSVVALPDGGALISQRGDGRIVEPAGAEGVREVGVVSDVESGGESGLHGLAVWSEDARTWLYAYYGAADDNRVVRMPLTGERGSYAFGEPELVVDGIARASTHNGGRIAFGPDGMLYIATGDAADPASAQDLGSLNGKILRVTPEGAPAEGNPGDSAVWSWGHRNVQGLGWTSDGVMWASEFGANAWDELNVIEVGANYGWPSVEGAAGDPEYVDPVLAWEPSQASPSGLATVGDTVFVASLRGQRVWVIDTVSGEPVASAAVYEGEYGRVRDAVAAPDGSLWLLTNNTDGRGSPREGDDVLMRVALVPVT